MRSAALLRWLRIDAGRTAAAVIPRRAYLSTEADVQRISATGILADIGFGITKLGCGTVCGSPALVADGAHSLADLLVGAVSYGAYAAARAPPDDDHPYGHGKFEAGGSLVVGGALVATGAAAAANTATMATAAPVEVMTLPAMAACAGVAALSIAGKEWLYRATLKAGDREEAIELPLAGNGYNYEAQEVARCLATGELESPVMPLDETVALMRILDEARTQIGLKYPME